MLQANQHACVQADPMKQHLHFRLSPKDRTYAETRENGLPWCFSSADADRLAVIKTKAGITVATRRDRDAAHA
jgi:hypothetical protein